MPIVSKVTLPSGNEYNLRDNSQGNSDHQHYYTNLVPLVHKVYESTSYYATAANYAKSTWYFASVKPDNWYLPWRVRFKYHTYCTANAAQHSYTWSTVCGRSDSTIYANFNEVQTSAHYYTVVRPMKKAGFDYGLGHAIGITIYASSNYTNSAYYRTFEIDYFECENCTVTILDTPVLWENWQNGTTTYYGDQVNQDAVNRGLRETGDDNTVTENRITHFAGKTGSKGIWANGLFMEDQYGTFQNICTGADGTVTSSSRTAATTKIANTNGFKVCGTIFYTNTNYNANTNISGSSVIYSSTSIFDTRYSFNTTLTANFLTPYQPLYLVGTIASDGLFYLDTVWWTQTPTDTSKVYVLVGGVYDSSTSYCRATLYEQNKWYRYDGTMLIEISNDAITVNGHTVESDVPSGSVFTDTKNTAGSTDTSSKIFLVGATEQAENPQTYSHDTAYVGTNGHLYSNGKQVVNLGDSQALTNKTYNGYTLGDACSKSTTDSVTSGSTALVTSGAVYSVLDGLPKPMVFKGTVGTGGTITTLPTNGTADVGHTYKVITDGTYAGQSAKVGDTFICDSKTSSANTWAHIPSGDEQYSDTWRNIKVNGTEKLGSGISTGAVDFVNGTNTTVSFNATGSKISVNSTDTKNTAGSTDTSSKIYLVGATSQSTNPQTYSDNEIYTTSGTLTTKEVSVGGGSCTMKYNTTTESLDFVFS